MTSSPGCASIEWPSMMTVTVVFGFSVEAAFSVVSSFSAAASGMGGLARLGVAIVAFAEPSWARFDAKGDGHAAPGDLRLELRAEAPDGAHDRGHGRRTQRADRGLAGREGDRRQAGLLEAGGRVGPGADVVADVEEEVDVGGSAVAVDDALQDLLQPAGALAAWRALAAGLPGEEAHHAEAGDDRVDAVVHDH